MERPGGGRVRGLLDHARIEGANDPEALSSQAEAARIAQRAAEALRRSRAACQTAAVHIPTWTGRHGSAGAPPGAAAATAAAAAAAAAGPRRFGTVANPLLARPAADAAAARGGGGGGDAGGASTSRGGTPAAAAAVAAGPFSGALAGARGGAAPSSQALLAQLRARSAQAVSAGTERSDAGGAAAPARPGPGAAPPPSAAGSGHGDADLLAARLVSFLESRGGSAGTAEVVAAFADVAPPQLPLLKRLLKQLATLRKRPGGGVWVLKVDFGGGANAAGGGGARAAGGAGAIGGGGGAAGPSTSRPQRNDFEGLGD